MYAERKRQVEEKRAADYAGLFADPEACSDHDLAAMTSVLTNPYKVSHFPSRVPYV